jgi:Amt family ammonium transporter
LLTGVFATSAINPIFKNAPVGLVDGHVRQLLNQAIGVLVAIIVAVIGSLIILKIVDLIIGFRVTREEEIVGLDISQHGEEGYELIG